MHVATNPAWSSHSGILATPGVEVDCILTSTAICCFASRLVWSSIRQRTFLLQPDMTPEMREAQNKARKLAETMAKAPAGWQPAQGPNTSYLPNGDVNPLVKAAQEAAMKLAQQVRRAFVTRMHMAHMHVVVGLGCFLLDQ